MSEGVETTTPAAPPTEEIIPAKSEDKLIIEAEEKESESQEPPTDKVEKADDKEKEDVDNDKKDEDNEADIGKKDEPASEKGADGEKDKEDDTKEEGRERRKFKLPSMELKAPKVPGFIRAISKERKKVRQI